VGPAAIKAEIRRDLKQGWSLLFDLPQAKQKFDSAHAKANPFVRLHICTHASLLVHAILSKDISLTVQETWLMMAAGPATLRNRIIRGVGKNHS